MKKHEQEARERYGNTKAYCEYEQKTKGYAKEKWAEASDEMAVIFGEFAKGGDLGFAPNSQEMQSLVGKLQDFITKNYYTCTDDILADLGKMYVCDERFKKNIDKYGKGAAELASAAISIYCNK